MRLTIKEPEINIGIDGFEGHCQLGRAETGKKLSELVEKIEDPIVIALDGSWGSGKSFFLKCWTGAHTKEYGEKTKVVYFDAFQHDFLEDPLIALTGVIADQFEANSNAAKAMGMAKQAISKMWRPAARIGLAVGTAGVSEGVGAVGGAAIASGSKAMSDASDMFWQKEDGRRAAMGEFRAALEKLTEPDADGNAQKLVIIVDELDRCRPDYALSLLEVMKHFFMVDNVHFVLGVNLIELQNSVRSRYGTEIDAGKYLQKFIQVTLSIEGDKWSRYSKKTSLTYFTHLAEKQGLTDEQYRFFIRSYLENMPLQTHPNLRACERLITSAVLAPNIYDLPFDPDAHIITGLLIMEAIDPNTAALARKGELSFETAQRMLGLTKGRSVTDPGFMNEATKRWWVCLAERLSADPKIPAWPASQITNRNDIVPRLAEMLWGTIRTLDIE